MKKNILIKLIFIGLLSTIFCNGCLNVKYVEQNHYLFNVNTPAKVPHSARFNKTLEVANTTIAPQFTGQSFIYRLNDITYTTDYYNIFFTSPPLQINQIVINYMRSKSIFSYVGHNIDFATVNYMLAPEILQLYADYRNPAHPKAILAMHFTLVNSVDDKNNIALSKTYQKAIPLARKDSASLVYAWNTALNQILNELSFDISRKL